MGARGVLWTLQWLVCGAAALRVALHAQVLPGPRQVVGSVVTTDGLARALRAHGSTAQTFHPSHYHGLFNQTWDVFIMEGWVPSIHDLLRAVRLQHPAMVILFYCLDPAYPNFNDVLHFEVDGILTNSRRLQVLFASKGRPSLFLPLAADPDEMSPGAALSLATPAVSHNVVYVGAGGAMLTGKPLLRSLLEAASGHGLAIYGKAWEDTGLEQHWRGVLPRYDLARVYATAKVVLASTLAAQESFGMVNNRIYDVLSCGGLVLTQEDDQIRALFGDVVFFYKGPVDAAVQMQRMLAMPDSERQEIRGRARAAVLAAHTWTHRVVDLLDWVRLMQRPAPSVPRSSRPQMLWIVSPVLRTHSDYLNVVEAHIRVAVGEQYNLTESAEIPEDLTAFDAVFLVAQPGDELDCSMQLRAVPRVRRTELWQRRAAYFLGSPRHAPPPNPLVYDLYAYRDAFDVRSWAAAGLSPPPLRMQHMFVVPMRPLSLSSPNDRLTPVVVCFRSYMAACSRPFRLQEVQQHVNGSSMDHRLVLLGGTVDDWRAVLDKEDLVLCQLVAHGGMQVLANLLRPGSPVVFMNPPSVDAASEVLAGDGAIWVHEGGAVDEIGAFVTAVAAGARIRLLQANSHWIELAQEGCGAWRPPALADMVTSGLQRLFGLPPAASDAQVSPLPLGGNATAWRGLLEHLEVSTSRVVVALRMRYERFAPGLDGSVCFTNPRDAAETYCVIRPLHLVLLSFPAGVSAERSVLVSLRGMLANDVRARLAVLTVHPAGTPRAVSRGDCEVSASTHIAFSTLD